MHLPDTLESVVSQPVAGRLATLVVSMIDQGEQTPEGVLLPPVSHEDLGKMIGATRESVSRTLSDWRQHGIISNQGRRILVRKLLVLRGNAAASA